MIGETLSHYKILDKLGAGGMGEVYLAEDTTLKRQVALKVLPSDLAASQMRLERFQREAESLAALNHPNIVHVYSVEEDGGTHFITMELVEGKPLSHLIRTGGMPLERIFEISIPLADALATAHEKRVIHRDLKPANIMVTNEGRVKVLDFGLAKLRQEAETPFSSQLPTEPLTEEGRLVGTMPYMPPEQLEGKEIDSRSDIFSLGVVLYELATGERPFKGESSASLIMSIGRDTPPDVDSMRAELPHHLGRVIRRCLQKNPERRFQSAKDVRNELDELRCEVESGDLVPSTDFGPAKTRRRHWKVYFGVAALAGAGLAGWLLLTQGEAPRPVLRTAPLTSWAGSERHPALSPRGDQIAFVWDGGSGQRFDLYVMLVGTDQPLRLTDGLGEIGYPAWSPDGLTIAFLRQQPKGGSQVITVPALGGAERILLASSEESLHQLDWSPDGRTLAFVEGLEGPGPTPIVLLSSETGERRVLTSPPAGPGTLDDLAPVFSPNGRSLAFVRWYETPKSEIYLQPLAGGATSLLATHESWIQGLDWMPDSAALLFSSSWQGATGLWRVALDGEVLQLGFGQEAGDLSIAAKGDRLVFAQEVTDSNIWRTSGPAAMDRVEPQRLIASTRDDWAPDYSPTGDRIALISDRSGKVQLWLCDGEGQDCSQYETEGWTSLPCWSPDGSRIAFSQDVGGQFDIFVGDLRGGFPRRLTRAESRDHAPVWSPDGHWIYYQSRHGDADQIWRVPAEGGEPEQVTTAGGTDPAVSGDDRYVYYWKPSRPPSLWRTPIAGGAETPVLEGHGLSPGAFELWQRGLVYLVQHKGGPASFEFLDLDTGQVEQVAHLGRKPQGRLSVSPDGRWIIHAQNDARGGDLILVENFGVDRRYP